MEKGRVIQNLMVISVKAFDRNQDEDRQTRWRTLNQEVRGGTINSSKLKFQFIYSFPLSASNLMLTGIALIYSNLSTSTMKSCDI